jgi:hypothetical protein
MTLAVALALLSFPFTQPQNRHFDRSCSRSHREQRSGEICFSTQTLKPLRHVSLILRLLFCCHPEGPALSESNGDLLLFLAVAFIFPRFPPKKRMSSPQTT